MNNTTLPTCFTPKALVLALRKALPFCVFAVFGTAVVSPAVGQSGDSSVLFTTTQLIRQFTLKNTVTQVSLGMQGTVVAANGVLRSTAMGPTLGVFLEGMGTVPAASNLPQLDGAGRPLGYCAWDNTATTPDANFFAGQPVAEASRLVYAVVSSGLDGIMDTSCANVLATRRGQGDDFVQFSTPSSGGSSQLIGSVATETDLASTPGGLGDIRLVRDTNKLYSHDGTSWNALTANNDPSGTVNGTDATFTGNVTADTGTFNTITVGGGGAGTITSTGFIGNGSALTDLNADNITSGVLSTARGGTGLDTSAAAQGALLIGNGGGFSLGTLAAGNGIGVLNGAGSITISNTGVLSITGTANQVIASANTGDIVLSLPQDIATNSLPTFGGMTLTGNLTATTASFAGAVSVDSLSALRLNVGTSAGVTFPNLIIGNGAMPGAQTGGGRNTAVGINALAAHTSGSSNTAVGFSALQNLNGSSGNTAAGSGALGILVSGNDNSAFGVSALRIATGSNNVAMGRDALGNSTSGVSNTAVGRSAGSANSTGSNNTFLGNQANAGNGALSYATAIGAGSTVATSNTLALGRNSALDQIVIGTDTRNDTFAGTKLYVNGVTNLNGDLRGTTATFTGALTADSFVGDGSGLTNLDVSDFTTGILPVAQGGTGLDGSAAPNGSLLIGNGTGYTLGTLTGTANQVNVSNGAGTITLSLPQDIATTSTPTFGGMALNGNLTGTTGTFTGAVTVDSLSAQRLNVSTSAGVTNPNLIIGNGAMTGVQSGVGNNIAVGFNALRVNTSGDNNAAIGRNALQSNTTGLGNVAVGTNALRLNISGFSNTATGVNAMQRNTTGNENVASGRNTFDNNTTGSRNVTIGASAGQANTTGNDNTFLGFDADATSNALAFATAIGSGSFVATSNTLALGRNSTLDQIVMGTDTRNDTFAGTKLYVNGVTNLNGDLRGTTATFTGAVTANSFVGDGSGLTNLDAADFTTGILPVARGGTGLDGSAAPNGSLLIGNGTGYTLGTLTGTADQINVSNGAGTITLSLPQDIATTSTPTFGGLTLSGAISGTTGSFTGAVTVDSLSAQRLNVGTSAGGVTSPNLIIGNSAMTGVQSGVGANTAVGINALNANTSGQDNTAVGRIALQLNTTGIGNTAVGTNSMRSNTTGFSNTAVGVSVLRFNSTGDSNAAVGRNSLDNNTTGSRNASIGVIAGGTNTTGNDNTFLGYDADATTGTLSFATAIGSGSFVATSNTLALGRNSTTDQIVIGTDTRNDTFAGTKLYVNGVTNLNGDLRGTTATFTGAVTANSFVGDGSGLTNLDAADFTTGILPVARGGTGLDGSAAPNGSLLIGNGTGYTLGTLTGTANQINVSNGTGTITLSLPQSIATTSTPTFGGATLNGALTGTTGTFTGAVTVDSLSAQRLNVGTSAGGVTAANLIIGNSAMPGAQTGAGANTAVGISALNANTSGQDNTGVGYSALAVNTTGVGNTALGANALRLNTAGVSNTATGVNALQANTGGNNNVAIGRGTLALNNTGMLNTAIGFGAGSINTTGSDNTFLGNDANVTSGALTFATAIGSGSRVATSTTIALGRNSATDQIVMGAASRNDTFAGTKLYVNGVTNLNGDLRGTTATFNSAVTVNSLSAQRLNVGTTAGGVGLVNVIIGNAAMVGAQSGTGGNTAVGNNALNANTTGGLNIAVGRETLYINTTGSENTATGVSALTNNTTGNNNVALGRNTGLANTIGSNNTFIGSTANATSGALTYATAIGSDSTVATSATMALGRNSALDQIVIGTNTRNDTFAGTKLYVNGVTNLNGDLRGTTATFTGALTGTTGTFSGAVTVDSLSALRLNVGTSAGGVTNPNLIIGNTAMPGAQSGAGNNAVVGISALNQNTSGQRNTAVGNLALYANTTGSSNTANGFAALYSNTTGNTNVAIGNVALYGSTTGNNNVAIGNGAGYSSLGGSTTNANTTGGANTFLGSNAMPGTTTPLFNATALGAEATVSTSNTLALGRNSVTDQVVIGTDTRNDTTANTKLYVNGITRLNGDLRGTTSNFSGRVDAASLFVNGVEVTGGGGVTRTAIETALEGNFNIALGDGALENASFTGTNNTVFGVAAASLTTAASTQNVVIGRLAGQLLGRFTAADGNTLVGYQAGYQIQAASGGDYNTLIGHNSDGGSNISYGSALGASASVTGASYSTAVGAGASAASSSMIALGRNSVTDQVVIGSNTRNDTFANTKLYVNGPTNLNGDLRGTTATFTGAVTVDSLSALRLNVGTSAGPVTDANLIIGNGAMPGAQSGSGGNTAVGINALAANTLGRDNSVLGYNALSSNTTGRINTAVGYSAMTSNTDGTSNTAVGDTALRDNTIGGGNTAIGRSATSSNTTGSNNTSVGFLSGTGNVTGSYNSFFGQFSGVIGGGLNYVTSIGSSVRATSSDTVVLGALGSNKDGVVSSVDDQVVIGATSRLDNHKLYVVGTARITGGVTTSSDRRLKTNIDQLDGDAMLDKLGQIGAYRYNYIAMPEAGRKIGVIAQEIENLFPEVASYGGDNYLAVDYGALGAMAAAGVGRLNTKVKALDTKVEEQGTKLLELEELTGKHDTRIGALESWKTEAVGRMDNMQLAIDLNIQKIADNAVAIQTNAKAIERLDDALLLVDGQVKNNSDLINSINARWNQNFNASEDGSVLTVNAVELKVSNFTAQNIKASSVYSQRLEAEMARIAELEVNNLRANSAVANTVQAEQLNTGSAQVYAGAGLPAVLFSAKSDGHYTLSTSALDGSYATATVIVNAGQAKVIAGQNEGIELFAEGNTVKAIAAGKSIKASWIKTG